MAENSTQLLDALCRHRELLRRETESLRKEVASRGLSTFAGKKAYVSSNSRSTIHAPPQLVDPATTTLHKVSLPYLVGNSDEALGLLLSESDDMRRRIESLASILRGLGADSTATTGVSPEKIKMLYLMSRASLSISQYMARSGSSAIAKEEDDGASSYDQHRYRAGWESTWGSSMGGCGSFYDITTLSPMLFTPSTPGFSNYSATASNVLQIYSLEIVDLNVNLSWPLHVYRVVTARDAVDHNRNILFYRSRHNYQLVTKEDPYLRLTGPSRAIVAVDRVTFEVELKIRYRGADQRQEKASLTCSYSYGSARDTTPLFNGYCCAARLTLEQLPRAIQATVVGVRVVEGGWPFKYGCRVSCSFSADAEDPSPWEVVLLNCRHDEIPVGSDGYFRLSRNVVSVQLQSTMKVIIQAHSRSGHKVPKGHVDFPDQHCQTSKGSCLVGNSRVEVVVAWSLIVTNKIDLTL
ncbi:hypothetical protein ACQJBY_040652 [Aegilops geniculata]